MRSRVRQHEGGGGGGVVEQNQTQNEVAFLDLRRIRLQACAAFADS